MSYKTSDPDHWSSNMYFNERSRFYNFSPQASAVIYFLI